MKKFIKPLWAIILALSLTVALAACAQSPASGSSSSSSSSSSSGSSASSTKYKYGKIQIPALDGSTCQAPIYIAYEKGYLAEEGFDATLVAADDETRKVGLNNGTYPIVNGDFQFFPSIEQGVNVSVVDGLHQGCIKIVVPKGSSIKTAADLKGKKIGVDQIGGTPYQVAMLWLEKAGIDAKDGKDVTFVPFNDGNLEIAAAQKGEIAAAAIWDPYGALAIKNQGFTALVDIAKTPGFAGHYCCFLYASNKVLQSNPGEVAAILRAYHKAQAWIHDNPAAAVDIIVQKKYANITDKALAAQLLQSYNYPSAADQPTDVNAQQDVKYFVDQLNSVGVLHESDPDAFAAKIFKKVDLSK